MSAVRFGNSWIAAQGYQLTPPPLRMAGQDVFSAIRQFFADAAFTEDGGADSVTAQYLRPEQQVVDASSQEQSQLLIDLFVRENQVSLRNFRRVLGGPSSSC